MSQAAQLDETSTDHDRRLAISGRLTIKHISGVVPAFQALQPDQRPLTIDLGGIVRIDTAGAWLVHRLLRDWQASGVAATLENASPAATLLINEVAENDTSCEIRPAMPNRLLHRLDLIGGSLINAVHTLGNFMAFVGMTLTVAAQTVFERRPLRWNAVVHQMEVVGLNALGIIGLLLFLVGIVVAQQGAVQLRQFGADIFVVNLIGRSTMREMGVLLTAIMVAGRSGSAFAAQIGSMKLGQEIDAMRSIGMSPTEVLVLPRVIAMSLMMVLLSFYGSIMAIIGGGLYVWVAMGIPPASFATRLQEVVPIHDVYIGLIKAPVFGIAIAITGCFQGMQVSDNAESVGNRTTQAVVESIFLVIVLDAFFAVFFTAIDFG
ncbi:MlaE family lipid ABC transporter permease subunit [Polymorphobacter arshaanensis]|uniref:MlaE family lipid ABC transporter permease subunit n=1 Tax=Glacieibacterium arshaanense TaxID=2511025 RepID=A0A4Y9ELD4_9SPHN|nr:MlaE family lipid ABC transporter permease subunit [Polymorphobacter arshaanensis]TFU01339.1 MlaE family lipid ABC transporter permease subunit [Polymorphobacter arshaanensis]